MTAPPSNPITDKQIADVWDATMEQIKSSPATRAYYPISLDDRIIKFVHNIVKFLRTGEKI